MMGSIEIRSLVPRTHRSLSALEKILWQLGPVGLPEDKANVYPKAPALGRTPRHQARGRAWRSLTGGARVPRKNHSSGSLAWSETGPS
jgi:hypothetical protein